MQEVQGFLYEKQGRTIHWQIDSVLKKSDGIHSLQSQSIKPLEPQHACGLL